jgi:hypothetical protein
LSPSKVTTGVENERLILFRGPETDGNDIITGTDCASGLGRDGGFAAVQIVLACVEPDSVLD